MSLPKKLKMALAAAFTVGMIFTGAETVSAAPATSLGQSAGTVQELLGSDVQEARARGGGGGGMRGGMRGGGFRGGMRGGGFRGGVRGGGYRGGYRGGWRPHHRHRHWRGGYGVGIYGGGYCVRRVGWHYNSFGEYVFGPYRRCY